MAWADIVTFVFIASLLVISPGPNGVLIAKTVPTSGRVAGLANVAGFVTAFIFTGHCRFWASHLFWSNQQWPSPW
jgi:threonine/homoserine/homoserine lactone efflux protein